MNGPGEHREVDERLADWVDGRMNDRERERFLGELRVNPQLRADLEQYERTVGVLRAALRAPTTPVRLADRVMAGLASGAARPVAAVPRFRGRSLWASLACAAALLVGAVWLNGWLPTPAADQVAGHDVARKQERTDLGAAGSWTGGAQPEGAAKEPGAGSPSQSEAMKKGAVPRGVERNVADGERVDAFEPRSGLRVPAPGAEAPAPTPPAPDTAPTGLQQSTERDKAGGTAGTRSPQATRAEAKPDDAKPGAAQPDAVKLDDAKPDDAKPLESKRSGADPDGTRTGTPRSTSAPAPAGPTTGGPTAGGGRGPTTGGPAGPAGERTQPGSLGAATPGAPATPPPAAPTAPPAPASPAGPGDVVPPREPSAEERGLSDGAGPGARLGNPTFGARRGAAPRPQPAPGMVPMVLVDVTVDPTTVAKRAAAPRDEMRGETGTDAKERTATPAGDDARLESVRRGPARLDAAALQAALATFLDDAARGSDVGARTLTTAHGELRLSPVLGPSPELREPGGGAAGRGAAKPAAAAVDRTWLVEGARQDVEAVLAQVGRWARERQATMRAGETALPGASAKTSTDDGANRAESARTGDSVTSDRSEVAPKPTAEELADGAPSPVADPAATTTAGSGATNERVQLVLRLQLRPR